jgi:enoyl-CoA hydratase/carnithine racemase
VNPSISVDHRELNRRGPIATVTMHFMGELNILGRAEMTAFIEAFHALAEDDTLRAVVLRGAGERAFIGGANIKEMAALDPGSAKAFITLLHEMNAALRALPVPVIAQIRGYCLGGGMEVGAACDIRVSADDATFGMPEVRVGIPSVIEAALLPPLIGWGKTREVLYTGGMYSAAEMHACGFLERCVPANELDAITDHLLDGILQSGPNAIRTQKALMREWEKVSPEEAVHRGIAAFAASYETDEPTRAMRAFLDRKRPG